jgi:hypothetical protein
MAHSAVRRQKKRDFPVELRTIAVYSRRRADYESNDPLKPQTAPEPNGAAC